MRWTNKREIQIGQSKVVKRFAFFPVQIGATVVWLEFYNKHYSWIKPGLWDLRKLSLLETSN